MELWPAGFRTRCLLPPRQQVGQWLKRQHERTSGPAGGEEPDEAAGKDLRASRGSTARRLCRGGRQGIWEEYLCSDKKRERVAFRQGEIEGFGAESSNP